MKSEKEKYDSIISNPSIFPSIYLSLEYTIMTIIERIWKVKKYRIKPKVTQKYRLTRSDTHDMISIYSNVKCL